jgi:hypothetical protein
MHSFLSAMILKKDPRIHAVKWIAFAVPRIHYLLFPIPILVAQFPGVWLDTAKKIHKR